jgi:hypothetical protein
LPHQREHGGEVASFDEPTLATPESTGTVLRSEWHTVTDGRLTAGTVVFDTGQFRAVVSAAPQPR